MLLIQLSICCYSRGEQKPYTGATFVSLPGMWTTTSYLLYTNIYLTQGYSIKINAGSLRKIFKTSLCWLLWSTHLPPNPFCPALLYAPGNWLSPMENAIWIISLAGRLLGRVSQWQAEGQRAAGRGKTGVLVPCSFPALCLSRTTSHSC